MPRTPDCCFQKRTWIRKQQAHRLPKKLHGNREQLPQENSHSYVPRFSSHFTDYRVVKLFAMADDRCESQIH